MKRGMNLVQEYLFRGRRIFDGEWVFGSLMHNVTPSDTATIVSRQGGKFYEDEVDPSTVGQFIGMEDQWGTKIFEGDTVKCWEGEFHNDSGIVWRHESSLYIDSMRHWYVLSDLQNSDLLEVVAEE